MSHCNSHVVEASALYLASEEDLDTVFCFLVFQETKELPMKMQYHVTDRRESMQVAQSASLKPAI